MANLVLPSFAKINLGLLIKGKRDDGFHEIETLLHQISLKDDIELQTGDFDDILFSCNNQDIPDDEENLCVKAARLLKKRYGYRGGVEIHLSKNIPVGAGLGGGSSNAAVVLLGLNKLWHLALPQAKLIELAGQLGSDVPFFITGGTALATGRGEILQPGYIHNPLHILVVFPMVNIPTGWAYNQVNLNLTRTMESVNLAYFSNLDFAEGDLDYSSSLINHFESVILPLYPVIGQIKQCMSEADTVYASMSGSGSAVFGMFQQREQAENLKQKFEGAYQCFLANHKQWGYGQM